LTRPSRYTRLTLSLRFAGKNFGASFSHETHQYIHLKVDTQDVIIFKSKDSPFDFDQV